MRAAEASASLTGLYGSLASDEDDEDYVRCYPSSPPLYPRPAHYDEARGSGVAREDTLLPITTSQSTATPAVPYSFVEI